MLPPHKYNLRENLDDGKIRKPSWKVSITVAVTQTNGISCCYPFKIYIKNHSWKSQNEKQKKTIAEHFSNFSFSYLGEENKYFILLLLI